MEVVTLGWAAGLRRSHPQKAAKPPPYLVSYKGNMGSDDGKTLTSGHNDFYIQCKTSYISPPYNAPRTEAKHSHEAASFRAKYDHLPPSPCFYSHFIPQVAG